jgi:hypothetical protein
LVNESLDYARPSRPELKWWNDPRQGWKFALVVLGCTVIVAVVGVIVVCALIVTSPF